MNVKAAFQIDIPKRSPSCMKGGEPFVAGMEYYAVLAESEEGVYTRSDFCTECWRQLQQQKELQQIKSSWKSVVPWKKQPSELPKRRDARALYLLRESLNSGDKGSNGEAFVLSLYLARRRLIAFRQEMKLDGGHPATLYEVMETEEMLCIPKLSFSELRINEIQTALAKKFGE